MIAAFVGIIDFGILPQIERSSKPMKAMAQTVMAYWRPGERICFSGVRQGFSLDYYTNGPPVVSVGHNVDDVPPSKFFSSSVPALCVVDAASYAQLAHEGYRLQIVRQTRNLWLTHWK
jgi:hypothetical protein